MCFMKKAANLLCMLILILSFSSCKNCKDCHIEYETLNGYNMSELNTAAQLMGYADWDAYMGSLYPTQEFCDDNLDAAENVSEEADLNIDGIMDYRVYWHCD